MRARSRLVQMDLKTQYEKQPAAPARPARVAFHRQSAGHAEQPCVDNVHALEPGTQCVESSSLRQISTEVIVSFTDSDLIRVNVFGSNILIANSLEVATDLLEKRSANYSDR